MKNVMLILKNQVYIQLLLNNIHPQNLSVLQNRGADTGKKLTSSKFLGFPKFYPIFPRFSQRFPDFSQRFPDFSLTKFFKVRKCERCGSLNPYLEQHDVFFTRLQSIGTAMILDSQKPEISGLSTANAYEYKTKMKQRQKKKKTFSLASHQSIFVPERHSSAFRP